MPDPTTDVALPTPATLPALVTPFTADEAVDHDALADLVTRTVDRGVDGLVPCGTTGEFASLSRAERRAVVATTVDAADGRVPVVAGAAGTTPATVREYVTDAADAGADAALVPPAYFHAANDPAGNVAFFERVADGSDLPVYLYNIPSCASGPLAPETVATLAAHDAVHGIKDTSGAFSTVERFLAETPDAFRILEGYDDHFVGAGAMGADGGINALANVVPGAFRTLCGAIDAGEYGTARTVQQAVLSPLFDACLDHGFAPATKAALAARGVLDTPTVRLPLVALDADARSTLAGTVADAVAAAAEFDTD